MTASTRFFKRKNSENFAPVSMSAACVYMPLRREEPVQLTLKLMTGKRFVITMSATETDALAQLLRLYADRLKAERAVKA